MSNSYDISKGQHNTAFVGDDGKRNFSPVVEKTENSGYVLELTDKKSDKNFLYDPYENRKVEHPTT